ncbi:hypothetical protein DMENIID0001_141840 [Sergentomyia squamirostris]
MNEKGQRGITPPHRVKSISMATFTPDEIEFIRSHGNDECAKTWLGLWDPKRTRPHDQRELMIDKYERKRYYLEPASPLKSLPSSQQLTTCVSSSIASSAPTTTNSVTVDSTAVLKSITLTPPQSLRLHNNKNSRSTTNATVNFQHQFTPDSETSLFNLGNSQTRLNNNNNNHIGGHQNGLTNNTSSNLSGIIVANNNNNKFTPDTDFVADFGSANIFNASSATMVNSTTKNCSPDKIANGSSSSSSTSSGQQKVNGNCGVNENFADFEHNPIYNAAAYQTTPPPQSASTQWSFWHQFQWPLQPPEQNRWSLPMSLSSSNSLNSSSGGFASNSSLNSTPSADRYAALKDLDEQLRETKEREVPPAFAGTNPNPFKNPFQVNTGAPWAATSDSVFNTSSQMAPAYTTVTNGFTNGYGKVPETSATFNNGSANFSFNPFATTSTTHSTNPFL